MRKFGPGPSLTRHRPVSISKEGKSPEGAATGAASGALSGAASGAAAGAPLGPKGMVVGGVIGAITGGATGGMSGYKSGPTAEHAKEAVTGLTGIADARKKAAAKKAEEVAKAAKKKAADLKPVKNYTRAQIKKEYDALPWGRS